MNTIYRQLVSRFVAGIGRIAAGKEILDPQIRPTTDEKFGDYQCNIAFPLAARLKKKPLQIANDLKDELALTDICERVEIAGGGFINLFLSPQCLKLQLDSIKNDGRLGVEKTANPQRHVIDFSSPNLAKEMHVGHLRTTITGEALARILTFMGHEVLRVNHVGDWGTQFGMLLQYIEESKPIVVKNPEKFAVSDLEAFYKAAKERFDGDEGFKQKAREKVVLLQSGDKAAMSVWRAFVKESLRHCHEVYDILGVTLTDVGESFYNKHLPQIVEELKAKGLARSDQGAVCVFLPGFVGREGEPLPMIIQKSDGGYNYDTTDLAALKHRVVELGARRLIYVTDLRQGQHFAMLFAAARLAGWVDNSVRLDHIGSGMVLSSDRKPFKTRDGKVVKLKDLLNEAVDRAKGIVEKGDYTDLQKKEIARAVGIAAVKYADLSHNLAGDYVFSWDKMLSMDGNTGPYMLYAYARIQSLWRKAGLVIDDTISRAAPILQHPTEIKLGKELLRFGDVVQTVSEELKPNVLTDYLYNLAKAFSLFYDRKLGVPILEARGKGLRESRLLLCALTAKTLKLGLNLLSIDVVDAM